MSTVSSLTKALFQSARKSRGVRTLTKEQPMPESVRNDKLQRADFVGQTLPGLDEVQSAQVGNDIVAFRRARGKGPGERLGIDVLKGESLDWPLTRAIMARHRDNSFFGTKTGMPTYDDFMNQTGRAADKGKEVEIIRMTPEEYITFATDTLNHRQLQEGLSELSVDAVKGTRTGERLDEVMNAMIHEGNFDIPVLDYTDMSQEGLHRAIAAQKLGIQDMPVLVVRSNMPVEMTQELGEDSSFFRIRQIGADNQEKGFLLAARDGDGKFKVVESEMDYAFRGRGLGLEMYEEMANTILRSGGRMASDQVVSGDAQRVYQSMAKIGYGIKWNSNVRDVGGTIADVRARGGVLKSTDGEPVVEIIRLPRRPQDEYNPKSTQHAAREEPTLDNVRLKSLERARAQQDILQNQMESDLVDIRVSRELLEQLKDMGLDIE